MAESRMGDNEPSKYVKVFNSLKNIGEVYSWHASKNIATILSEEEGEKFSINSLENEFKLITKPNFNHFYELANFYKTNQYFKESIKYSEQVGRYLQFEGK